MYALGVIIHSLGLYRYFLGSCEHVYHLISSIVSGIVFLCCWYCESMLGLLEYWGRVDYLYTLGLVAYLGPFEDFGVIESM